MLLVRFPPDKRQAALGEIGDIDPKIEIRDERRTLKVRLSDLRDGGDALLVQSAEAGAAPERLPIADVPAIRTLAAVQIPADAWLLIEMDHPRDHVQTVIFAGVLLAFAAINLLGLARGLKKIMSLRIYDTRAKRKIDWTPLSGKQVGVYACGITPYDLCHVGHARMLVAFDVIIRHLRASGFDVRFVRNVTDIDDKIIRRGHTEGRSAAAVALEYSAAMEADMRALGIAPADVEPRATEHIAEVLEVVQRLVDRGLAYAAEGDVYYAVGSFAGYGQLSGQSTDDLKAGARIEIGEHKRSPLDFALWKGAKPGEPQWPSPWGPGRPGWHIECSAMAYRYLGETFDLHGGGSDLIFPHHENEIAQSEGAFGDGRFARHWLHSGMVNFGGEKMSKSLGNVVTIRRVAETHDLESLRLLMISVHYRSPVAFEIARDSEGRQSYPDLDEAEARLEYFYRTLERLAESPLPAPGDVGRGAATGRHDAGLVPRGAGRRLQHGGGARAPLRVVRAGQQAARRSQGRGQGRAPADAGAAARRLAHVRRDAGHLPAHAVGVPAGAARAHLRAPQHRPGRGRGAHRRARGRPRRQGLRPRRRDPQVAAGDRHRADGQPERHDLARGLKQASGFGLQALRSRMRSLKPEV